ncbi:excitatory amino acid transporter 1-like [Mizuhopecten yessoensis]|uniref:Amino acid transporter n=1 Tax=Mizuhopecten yessoensis TaxID=6573 RepID=A0A210PRH1_MIZYE|nr:excitatory amino acid transporter 1-like [Mizuhopecten yessoensis]XP_021377100.1 excitatory amino acid transporter 1-like [Mizuhopecten yessoensis]OWF39054.1 Excitatory amino acid transporter 1 [Mizuhopecten yessoensis]
MMEPNPDQQKLNTHIVIPVPEEGTGPHRTKLQRFKQTCGKNVKENLILILLLGSVVMGVAIGFAVRSGTKMTKREIMYLSFPGEMLMRMLKMLILPLIVSSLIAGIAGLDAKTCGKMGLRTMAYFATTTLLAVILGITMAVIIQPGRNADRSKIQRYGKTEKLNTADTFLDLIRNLFPENLIVSCITGYRTALKEEVIEKKILNNTFNGTGYNDSIILANGTNHTIDELATIVREVISVPTKGETGQVNILGLVVFSVCMGVIIGRMGPRGKPIVDFCNCLVEATMNLFIVFIWYSPVGIMFLIAGKIVAMEDFSVLLTQVGLYFLTVLCGLFLHGALVLPGLYFLCTRKNPYKFMCGIFQAMATAFGTSSSSATMPVTLHCLEHNNHIDPRVSTFVIPVGATINMDGTALYEAVAALFIAQVNAVSMSFGQIVTISITATAASIGAAGVPQAGLVTMVIVLAAVGLPIDDITLILVVDWFLDRFRTMTNVTGDSLGAGLVYELSKHELAPLEAEEAGPTAVTTDNPGSNKAVSNGTDSMTAV